MSQFLRAFAAAALAVSLLVNPAFSDQSPAEQRAAARGILAMLPGDAVTNHVLETSGQKLAYTAIAGTFDLRDQSGERTAAVFYTAYTLDGVDRAARPVTFAFNGGPGAASTYLHLGLAGPQVISFGNGQDGAAARLSPNPDTWLTFTDLVMIDPVGAGWSRAAKPDGANSFWNVDADAQSIAKVIALYLAKNSRIGAPVYLMGESYGGYRAVKVARALQRDQGLFLTGVVMVSPYLDGSLHFAANRYPLGAALHLPSIAAAALDREGRFTPEALAAADRFAMTEYLVTLAGRPPEGDAAERFYARVAQISGLPIEAVRRTRGFIRDAYVKQAHGQVASAYDATILAPDPYPESPGADGPDPVLSGFSLALSSSFVGYARDVLGYKTEMTYHLINREVSGKWGWGRGGRAQASVAGDLRELLALNPRLRVLVSHGRSDIVTPYAASRYVLDHLPPLGGPDRTALKIYRGGHMFYFDASARGAFTADAAAFYRAAGL